MTTELRAHRPHPLHAALPWLVPTAVIAAMLLALRPAPMPVTSVTSVASVASPARGAVVPPASTGAAWRPDHSAVDWSQLEAAPDPSPMSVAAYDQ
jgi:hypothetical protein